jgi:hypothetical protein
MWQVANGNMEIHVVPFSYIVQMVMFPISNSLVPSSIKAKKNSWDAPKSKQNCDDKKYKD